MKTYLVTGAAGFIGSSVASKFLKEGHKVVTIDNLSTGHVSAIPIGTEFYEGDCQDPELIESLTKFKFDAIFHIAGQSSGEVSFDDPVYDLQTNTQSTLLLLKLAIKTGCENFIYASTMSVYGDQPDVAVSEVSSTNPKSFYGVGKLASEQYLRIYQNYGVKCSALRLFNVYGPGQNMDNLKQGMVSIFMAQAINDNHIHVKGSADRYRDFVFIDDVVAAFLKAMDRESDDFSIINVCTGVKTTVGDVVESIRSEIPYEVSVNYEGGTPGDQFGITGNNILAKSSIDWSPSIGFKSGIKTMISWALKELESKKS